MAPGRAGDELAGPTPRGTGDAITAAPSSRLTAARASSVTSAAGPAARRSRLQDGARSRVAGPLQLPSDRPPPPAPPFGGQVRARPAWPAAAGPLLDLRRRLAPSSRACGGPRRLAATSSANFRCAPFSPASKSSESSSATSFATAASSTAGDSTGEIRFFRYGTASPRRRGQPFDRSPRRGAARSQVGPQGVELLGAEGLRRLRPTGRGVPQQDGRVLAAGRQTAAVRREGQRRDGAEAAGELAGARLAREDFVDAGLSPCSGWGVCDATARSRPSAEKAGAARVNSLAGGACHRASAVSASQTLTLPPWSAAASTRPSGE